MPQSPQNSTFRRLYEDFQKGGGLGNTLKAAGAGLLGFPSDIVQTMAAVAQPPALRAAYGSPQVPGNSEQIAGLLGADLERPTGMLGLLGAPDPTDIGRVGGGLLGHTLFHGTPHRFDMFELSDKTIGTGEGAQAYGHGLYFAESPDVAKSYTPRDFDAEEVMMQRYKAAESAEDYETMELWERAMMHDTGDEIRDVYKSTDYDDSMRAKANAVADEVDELARQSQSGHIYEVEIPDSVRDKMLDWDKPLSEQPESVRKALKALRGQDVAIDAALSNKSTTGGGLYGALTASSPDASGAFTSSQLREAGIPGIRYYDGSSRKAQEGTRNVVLFDTDVIEQVKRDGELVYKAKGM